MEVILMILAFGLVVGAIAITVNILNQKRRQALRAIAEQLSRLIFVKL